MSWDARIVFMNRLYKLRLPSPMKSHVIALGSYLCWGPGMGAKSGREFKVDQKTLGDVLGVTDRTARRIITILRLCGMETENRPTGHGCRVETWFGGFAGEFMAKEINAAAKSHRIRVSYEKPNPIGHGCPGSIQEVSKIKIAPAVPETHFQTEATVMSITATVASSEVLYEEGVGGQEAASGCQEDEGTKPSPLGDASGEGRPQPPLPSGSPLSSAPLGVGGVVHPVPRRKPTGPMVAVKPAIPRAPMRPEVVAQREQDARDKQIQAWREKWHASRKAAEVAH